MGPPTDGQSPRLRNITTCIAYAESTLSVNGNQHTTHLYTSCERKRDATCAFYICVAPALLFVNIGRYIKAQTIVKSNET